MFYKYLNDQELLSKILGNRVIIDDLFYRFGNLSTILYNTSQEELIEIKGIGNKKAQQLLGIREVITRLDNYKWINSQYKIRCAKDAVDLMRDMKHLKHEEFRYILLDTKNQVLQVDTISKGTLNATLIHPREVFNEAIKKRCASLIMVHNHPSGNAQPSLKDACMTKRFVEAGEIIGIKVLDHLIIGESYYSFKENELV